MPRLVWETRQYEAGVSRGVFYPFGDIGRVWNGLISVTESVSGAERSFHYLDGMKFLELVGSTNYQASIASFSIPPKFRPCIGERDYIPGVRLANQPKLRFHFCYRTELSDGYKLHLVYNALARMAARDYATEGEQTDPSVLTCEIVTTPVDIPNVKPAAHFVVDSTQTPESALSELEDILYGNDTQVARFPTLEELISLFVLEVP